MVSAKSFFAHSVLRNQGVALVSFLTVIGCLAAPLTSGQAGLVAKPNQTKLENPQSPEMQLMLILHQNGSVIVRPHLAPMSTQQE